MRTRVLVKAVCCCGVACLLGLGAIPARAVDGTWSKNANGSWTATANWLNSIIADGANATAYFVKDIDRNVTNTLDGARTIGNLTFEDPNSTHGWAIITGTGGPLTLDVTSGIPVINVVTKTTTINAVLAGNDGMKKSGTSTLILGGANTYTGGTTVNRGMLLLDASSGSLVAGSGLTFDGTGTYNYQSDVAGSSQSLGALTFSSGYGTILSTYGSGGNTVLTFSSLAARGAGAAGNIVVTNGVNGTNNKVVLTAAPLAGTLIDRGLFFYEGSYAAYDEAGFVRAYNYASDSNAVTSAGGVTMGAVNSGNNVQTTGAISAQDSVAINTLNINGSNKVTLAAGATLTVKGILKSGNNASSITNGAGITTGNADELVLCAYQTNDSLTIDSPVAASSIGGVTKSGAGTVKLNGTKSYTGPTTVNSGTLVLRGTAQTFTGDITVQNGTLKVGDLSSLLDSSFGNAANNINLLNGATLQLSEFNGENIIFNPLRSFNISGGVSIKPANGAPSFNIPGNIVGTDSLSLTGGGCPLSGSNTFTGKLILNSVIRISSDANIGGSNSTIGFTAFNNTVGFVILGTNLTNFSGHTFPDLGGNSAIWYLDVQEPSNTFYWDKNVSALANGAGSVAMKKYGLGTWRIAAPQDFYAVQADAMAWGMYGGTFLIDTAAGGRLANRRVNDNNRLDFGGGTYYLLGQGGALVTTQNQGDIKVNIGGGSIVVDNNGGSGSTTLDMGRFFSPWGQINGGTLDIRTVNPGTGSSMIRTYGTNDATGIAGAGRVVFNGADWASSGSTSADGVAYDGTANTVTGNQANGTLVVFTAGAPGGITVNYGYYVVNADGSTFKLATTPGGAAIDLTSTGSGTLATMGSLGGYSGYTVGLPASGGSSAVNYSHTGNASVTASETVNTLKLATSGAGQSLAIDPGQTLTLESGGLLFTGAQDYSITGGNLAGNTNTASDLIIHHYGAGTLTIGSTLADRNGASVLTIAGTGTVVLTSANLNRGATYVNGAVLSISNNNQLNNGGNTNLYLYHATLRATETITTGRSVILGGGGASFDVVNGKTLTLSGAITSGRLTLANTDGGSGTLIIGNSGNTFSGGVVVEAGILRLNHNSAIGSFGLNTLSFGSGTTAMLQIYGARTINVAGLNSSTANAVIENGAAGAALLQVYNGWDNTFAGTLRDGAAGTLALTKAGCGKLTLSGNSTYTGDTTVLGGTLEVNGSLAGPVILSRGTLSGTGTVGAVTVASGAQVTVGNSATPATLTTAGLTLPEGATLAFDVAGGIADRIVVNGTLTLPSSATLTLLGAVGSSDQLTLFESSSPILGSPANWSGVPDTHTLIVSRDGLRVILRPKVQGLIFSVE